MSILYEFDCPKCEGEEAFKLSFVPSDNGLPGAYFKAFLEVDEVHQSCDCAFTDEELNAFLQKCAEEQERSYLDD